MNCGSERWPAQTRSQLLAKLAEEGARQLQDDEARRRARIADTSGALTGVYGSDYLSELAEDWPA